VGLGEGELNHGTVMLPAGKERQCKSDK
jgi:hypothetical protein